MRTKDYLRHDITNAVVLVICALMVLICRFAGIDIEREAKGTLCADLIPAGDTPKGIVPRKKVHETFTYYDIDKKGWRAFKVRAFVEVQQRKVIKAYSEADR